MNKKYWVWRMTETFSVTLEKFLNSQYEKGWKLHTLTIIGDDTFIIIFEKIEKNDR